MRRVLRASALNVWVRSDEPAVAAAYRLEAGRPILPGWMDAAYRRLSI